LGQNNGNRLKCEFFLSANVWVMAVRSAIEKYDLEEERTALENEESMEISEKM
jgi:hypothetical protein